MPATVSIIIPAFNAAPYIIEAIDSALKQTQAVHEIIVVDDGSTDNTPEIAALRKAKITLLRQTNQGVSIARNRGARESTGEWLLFLDADDRLLPMAVELLLQRAGQGAFGVVYGQSVFITDHQTPRLHGTANAEGPIPTAACAAFWRSMMSTPGAALVRKELFTNVGGFCPLYDTVADRDFWIRAGMVSAFGFTPFPVIEKRTHGTNMSIDRNRSRMQAIKVQFGILAWCSARGLDSSCFKVTARVILENALHHAINENSIPAAQWICQEAATQHVSSFKIFRARILLAMPSRIRRLAQFAYRWGN
jgi:glycosyltransferase involved in cell wall biosynthesis